MTEEHSDLVAKRQRFIERQIDAHPDVVVDDAPPTAQASSPAVNDDDSTPGYKPRVDTDDDGPEAEQDSRAPENGDGSSDQDRDAHSTADGSSTGSR